MSPKPTPTFGRSEMRRPEHRRSEAIRIARIACILGVVYVHAWTGLSGDALAAADGSAQGVLRWGLMELFGRAAVPLLGLISGWLVVDSARRRPGYGAFVGHKARTLLLPMVLWNLAAIILVSGAAAAGLIQAPVPEGLRWWVDELTSLTRPNHINVQAPFLRDLFVCVAAAPLLARAPLPVLVAVAVGAAVWSLSGVPSLVLLRPAVLVYFSLGILVRRTKAEARVAGAPLAATGLVFVALAALSVWFATGHAPAGFEAAVRASTDLALRLAAAVFFWGAAWRLVGTSLGTRLARLEPYAFLMFCAHLIVIWLAGPMIGRLTGPLGAPLYPVFLIAQPFLVLLAVRGVGVVLTSSSPALAYVLSGRRLGRKAVLVEAA